MASLAVEYRPKKFSDVVEQDAVVKMLEGICKSDELKNRNFLLIGPAGTGKAQPMWSKVLTVDGFLPMRQIQIGMKVYTHNGNIAKITGIYPQGERDIYTIYTKSGEYIDVADNHLNVIVQYKNSEMVEQVVDTLTLLNIYNRNPHNIYLPVYNITDHTIKQYTQITKIMYSGCYHCQCIMLDHEDHTYMTDGYIVTHNTTLGRIVSNELNDGKGEPIEIDAASHSGVDNVREIISQARTYPIGCKYKVFILDECFPGNTPVKTPEGSKSIKDICIGDTVYGINGEDEVINVFENRVSPSNLLCMVVDGKYIITTKSHLFFTDEGWVEAKNLKVGDILYDYKYMRSVWERVPKISQRSQKNLFERLRKNFASTQCSEALSKTKDSFVRENLSHMWKNLSNISECEFNNLFEEVWKSVYPYTRFDTETAEEYGKSLVRLCLSRMWEDKKITNILSSDDLQSEMCNDIYEEQSYSESSCCLYKILSSLWEYIRYDESGKENLQQGMSVQTDFGISERCTKSKQRKIFSREQPFTKSGVTCKNVRYQTKEQLEPAEGIAYELRKWTHLSTSEAIERLFRRWLGVRISCSDSSWSKQSDALSYQLQIRPSLSRFKIGDRGGWSGASVEFTTASIGSKESQLLRKSRVESVEVYKPGDNDGLFNCCFSDQELHSEYVKMYDLELKNYPSYFAHDVLVHNCHSFSNTAWQSFLKVLEEGPAKTVFVFCTTNPEKIPATILSRVQTFQLSKISLDGIYSRLKYVLDSEISNGRDIKYDEDTLKFIAKLANGGMRDSLTLLDTALTYSNIINSENVSKALNLPDYDSYFELLSAYAKHDNVSITKIVDAVYNSGVNFTKWFERFHSFIVNIMKYIYLKDINLTMIPSHYIDKIQKYNTNHAIICLHLANVLVKLNHELKSTQYLQELALTYLCTTPKKG